VSEQRVWSLIGAAAAAASLLVGCGSGAGTAAPTERASDPAPSNRQPPAAISLDSGWRFAPDPRDVGLAQGWARTQHAPSAPAAVPSVFNPLVRRVHYAGTIGWYSLRFTAPPAEAGRSWDLRFEGVRRTARVWLNGRKLGASSDPYAPFTLRASSLRPGTSNLLVVRVDSAAGPGSFPQDWWNWGGIVRDVTLVPVGRLALDDLGVMPQLGCDYACATLRVQGTLRNVSTAALRAGIDVRVTSPSGTSWIVRERVARPLRTGASVPISFRVPIPSRPELWSPSHPELYRVQVATVAGKRIEQVDSLHVGMRSVKVSHGILYLNGHRLWLHGASIHEDVDGRGAALTDGDIDTIVSSLLSVGANITRAHYLLSDRLLDALDQAGIMVWSQPPVDHADAELVSVGGRRRALAMLRSTIVGERSHPSVIVDSVANELSPTPEAQAGTRSYLDRAIALARRLDPVAVVGLDTYCYPGFPAQRIYSKLDVLGVDSYFGWYKGLPGHSIASLHQFEPFLRQSHARYPRQALVVSEFGSEGVFNGSPQARGSYQFQSDYLRRTYAVLDRLPFMNGSIYWALRDFAVAPGWTGGVEFPSGYDTDGLTHKGLLAYDGTEKPAFTVASQLFAQTPAFMRSAQVDGGRG
jgi:Glycosyl hydrolases family 2, TIM barrel domain/Glycosyl hydrolases family 2, sugar binding domain/Glycosyl hydrolases family 2